MYERTSVSPSDDFSDLCEPEPPPAPPTSEQLLWKAWHDRGWSVVQRECADLIHLHAECLRLAQEWRQQFARLTDEERHKADADLRAVREEAERRKTPEQRAADEAQDEAACERQRLADASIKSVTAGLDLSSITQADLSLKARLITDQAHYWESLYEWGAGLGRRDRQAWRDANDARWLVCREIGRRATCDRP